MALSREQLEANLREKLEQATRMRLTKLVEKAEALQVFKEDLNALDESIRDIIRELDDCQQALPFGAAESAPSEVE